MSTAQIVATRKKILFVDDEPRILSALRRSFYHKNSEWDISYAMSPEEALSLLQQNSFNAIITDMRMPHMDGAKLLELVKNQSPETIRIVLSGQTELEMVMRTVKVAHQFLTKPCDTQYLEEVIERSCHLQEILNNPNVISLIGKIDSLPTPPTIYQDLITLLSKPSANAQEIASMIEKDIALSAKILQLVNSAFFKLPRPTTSIFDAINYIGFDTLKTLTLGFGVFNALDEKNKKSTFSLEVLEHHSLLCGHFAEQLLSDPQKSREAYLAGMLHDIGKIILMTHLPEVYESIMQQAKDQKQPQYLIEQQVLGITHAQIGGYLLGIWGIPYPVVEAVMYHHDPMRVPQMHFDVLGATYIANCLLENEEYLRTIDITYLKKLDVDHLLPKWQKMAALIRDQRDFL